MEQIQIGGRRVAGFGVGSVFLPDHNTNEVRALITLFDGRMKEMGDSLNAFGPTWVSIDPNAYGDFFNDYLALQARYVAAKNAAKPEVSFWGSLPDAAYESISKSVRQSYPPDGAPVQKGDWVDLFNCLSAAQKAANAAQISDHLPTSSALVDVEKNDPVMKLYRATAPYDVIAKLSGDEKSDLPDLHDPFKWFREHRTGLTIGATVVVGRILYSVLRK